MPETSRSVMLEIDEGDVLLDALETAWYAWSAPGARGVDELTPIMAAFGFKFEGED
jgi:hypothetical protein